MKWWVAGTAGAALILAGASIWLGLGAGVMQAAADDILFASLVIAMPAWVLGMRIARQRQHMNRLLILTLVVLVLFMMLGPGSIPGIDRFLRPYCSQYNASDICLQSAPLWVDIFDLVPTFALPIAVLLSTFWPHRAEPQQAQGVAEKTSRQ